ncbi:MAG TPA: hypothetical protein PLM07_13785 [Candidatus Rifleibacterium sp.]|nr:hypothetical protein [Candidatus Rifleibacterium sp.]HPT46957.1 hypothetical protein [Candidatus Rifleibacterium sp.]
MSPQIELIKNLFSELFAKLMAFTLEEEFLQDLGESLEIFYNLQEGEEYEFDPTEEFLFLSWFLLDDSDASDNCLMDEFLRRNADELNLQEMQVCKALKETHLTLLQVKSVVPGTSMTLKDVFLGEEFQVSESVGSDSVPDDSMLFTRVLRLGDARFLVGAGVFLDPAVLEPLSKFVTDQFKQDCEEGHIMSFKDFLKQNGELINWWIRAYEKGELNEDGPEGDSEPDPDSDPDAVG